jgi:hypothetical protein
MVQISQKVVDLQEFSDRLDAMHREIRRAKLSCDAVRDANTDFVLLSYIAEFERSERAFRRIRNGLEELDDAAQQGQLQTSDDVCLCGMIEGQFGEDPAWVSIAETVRERLKTASINVTASLASEIMCCNHALLSQLPDGTRLISENRHEKKSSLLSFLELCGLKKSVTMPIIPLAPPNPIKHIPPVPSGYKRIHAWPIGIRPDLANEMKFNIVPAKDEHEERNKMRERFDKVYKHIEAFLKEHEYTNPRTGQSTPPVLIEELNYLTAPTINALYKANVFTIADLVTLDEKKPFDLRKINRIAAAKVLQLQVGLSEVGIYRNGRAWFSLGKPKDPLSVKDLPASLTTALVPFFRDKDCKSLFKLGSYEASATHAQDELGFSWYDKQFGHMPWLYEDEIDDPKDSELVRGMRGVYGIPLSVYGNVQGREHPYYWKELEETEDE